MKVDIDALVVRYRVRARDHGLCHEMFSVQSEGATFKTVPKVRGWLLLNPAGQFHI
jgi:hypothetical protein